LDQEQGYLVSASCETVLHQDGTAIKVCQGAQQDDELRSNAESVAKISVCKLHSASRHGHACSNVPVPVAALTSPAREQGGPTDLVKHGMAARCILSHTHCFSGPQHAGSGGNKSTETKQDLVLFLFRWIHLSLYIIIVIVKTRRRNDLVIS
jgi:hypothetical protein